MLKIMTIKYSLIKTIFIMAGLSVVILSSNEAHAKASCPAQDFKSFLNAFEHNVQIQKAFTIKPLRWSSYYPEYGDKPNLSFLNVQEIEFPILISRAERSKQGITLMTKRRNSFWYQVFTRSEGTGAYSLDLDFKKRDGCWYLTDVVDLST